MAVYEHGSEYPLRWDHGPVSFGWMVAGSVVSWSAPGARDFLMSRCWRGVYLYPSDSLSDHELRREPIRLMDSVVYLTRAFPCDVDGDGNEDLLLTDRPGFIHASIRSGAYPNLSFSDPAVLRDKATGLPIKLLHDNPTAGKPNAEGGYIDPDFYCYVFPLVYPRQEDGGAHLVVGDSAGFLWWMEDESGAGAPASYSGEPYDVPADGVAYGVRYREQYGTSFVRPRHKVMNTRGEPLLLGEGADYGTTFPGGWVKPLRVRNPDTLRYDLVVLTGGGAAHLLYLRSAGYDDRGAPVFEDPVELEVPGMETTRFLGHGVPAVDDAEDPHLLLMPEAWKLGVLRWSWGGGGLPALALDRYVEGKSARACAYNITDILTDEDGERYALDSRHGIHGYELRRISTEPGGEIRLSYSVTGISDQDGIVAIRGETDNKAAGAWGFDRVTRWDYNPDRDEQDLVLGSDAGNLYLLLSEASSPRTGRYRSMGPLRDTAGEVIKVHNRVVAVGIDLDGNGREDLIVAGASYQMGIKRDPTPGADLFVIRNLGVEDDGETPRLSAPCRLIIEGLETDVRMNQNLQLQSIDIDGDGSKEVIVAFPSDGYTGRICRPNEAGDGLVYTGEYVDRLGLQERILDIDGDGELEYVFSGGETGLGHYATLRRKPE